MENRNEKPYFKKHLLDAKLYKGGDARNDENDGKKIYKLSSNENILGPSPKAVQAILDNLSTVNEYNHNFDTALKNALIPHHNHLCTSDQFITANSGVEILEVIMRGLLVPGDECIISSPTFMPYVLLADAQGAVVHDVPLTMPNYDWDMQGVLDKISDRTRLIFLTNPNNPTGTYIPKHLIDKFVDLIPSHVVIVYDEVYYQFALTEDYTNGMPYVQKGYPFICVNSFSKAYGLAGLRVGYAYTTLELGLYLNKVKRPFMINTLTTEAAIAALGDHSHIEKTIAYVEEGKRFLYKAFEALGIEYWPCQTNFILFTPPIDEMDMVDHMQKNGVMVRPGGNFGAPGKIRVTIGTAEANETFVSALRSSIK